MLISSLFLDIWIVTRFFKIFIYLIFVFTVVCLALQCTSLDISYLDDNFDYFLEVKNDRIRSKYMFFTCLCEDMLCVKGI